MTAPAAIPAIDAAAVPRLSEDGQRLAGAVLRLLAAGTAVSPQAAAEAPAAAARRPWKGH